MADEEKEIAIIPRSSTEQIQIAIKSYKGKNYLDLRIFYTTDDGKWLPTKKGITVSPSDIDKLKEAVDKAKAEFDAMEASEG